MKVLILKPSSLGDVVQALPVLRLIKQHRPESDIYWWIDSNLAPLLEQDPDLAGIVPFERQRWAAPRHWPELFRSVRLLRQKHFDWVIDLQSLLRSGIFAWLANGGLTVGLDEPREGAPGFYDLRVPRPSFYTHAVDWYLAVLPLLGVPVHWNFEWLPTRPNIANDLRARWGLGLDPWVVVQPGARWLNKRWPIEYFADLIRRLRKARADLRFAVCGSADDQPLGKVLEDAAPDRAVDLTGKLSLPEMVEWIRLSQLMVTNDTGPMHVAAALGTPVVALFGPTEPRRTGPYRQLHNVLQSRRHSHQAAYPSDQAPVALSCIPCLKSRCAYAQPLECLRTIEPAAVLHAVEQQLAQRPFGHSTAAPA